MKRLKLLVTGHRGLLGSDLAAGLAKEYEVTGIGRAECDLTRRPAVLEALKRLRPDLAVHAAAWTDVDGCEREPETAYRVNVLATGHLAEACQRLKIPLLYISTDFVFDGRKKSPYRESDPTNPIQVYGRSKLAGETAVQNLCERFFIVRTAWLFGRHGRTFPARILEAAHRGETAPVIRNQTGSPTYTVDLTRAVGEILRGGGYGLYHAVNLGAASRLELAREVLKQAGLKGRLKPVTAAELKLPARRPARSALRTLVLEAETGLKMAEWPEALHRYLAEETD